MPPVPSSQSSVPHSPILTCSQFISPAQFAAISAAKLAAKKINNTSNLSLPPLLHGPKNIPPQALNSRLQLFLLFLSGFINDHILPSSQERAAQRAEARKKKRVNITSRSHHKAPAFTQQTFFCFLAVSLLMSMAPLRAEEDYWCQGDDLWGNNFIRRTMSREAYHELKKCLVVDVKKMVEHLNQQFYQYWEPYSDVVIDESLIPTKARCPYTVVIKRKPHPVGVKLWSLVDRATYLFACSLFLKVSERTTETLLKMTTYLPKDRSFSIRTDSYFGSFEAALKLAKQGHQFTLACRKDRPSALFAQFLHSYAHVNTWSTVQHFDPVAPATRMTAIAFCQQKSNSEKLINFISNLYTGKQAIVKEKNVIPDIVHDYNLHMGYVDQMDSGCLQFTYPHRLINWKHAVFFWLIEATIRNSWIIWNSTHQGNEEDFQTFRRQLAFALRIEGLNLPTDHHGLIRLQKRRKCVVCLKIGRNSNTIYCCVYCRFLPLHRQCYPIYHPKRQSTQGRKRRRFAAAPASSST